VTATLSQRDLNRATLARQYLLERGTARVVDVIELRCAPPGSAPTSAADCREWTVMT